MRYAVLPVILLGFLTAAAPARAEPPAGIVMALTGDTDPKLTAMAEIPANTPVTLPPGAQLTFLHYARCKLVTVSGGTVTLSRADYRVKGKIDSETDGPCPRVYSLNDSGGGGHSTGGILARGIDTPPRWPLNPEFIFSGQRAGAVIAAAIFAEGKFDKPLVTLDLVGWRAREPAGAAGMVADGRYVLRLTMRDVREPVDVAFIGRAAAGTAPLVIVRVD